MLFSLLSLLLSVRIQQQYSNIIQLIIGKVSFLKRLSSKQYMLFSFFLDILFGFIVVSVIYSWLYSPAYQQQWESSFIVFLLLYSILKGFDSYRKTHIPPFQELIQLAPIPAKNLHITFVIAEWIWIGFTNFSTFFIYFMFQGYITDSIDFFFWIKHVNVVILSILLFVLSNKLFGAYMYNIVVKKIGWIRLVFFAVVSSVFFLYRFKKIVAYIPDKPLVYDALTGLEHKELIRSLWRLRKEGRALYEEKFQDLCRFFDLTHALEMPVKHYSLGMKYN
ncbi:hypothetical protein B5S25_04420 [Paenibacillus larvae subsp. pulvifaciens]|nr:hypothetical protein B5S25_04420 [Paenibacillus larvae subsp. pulvifaciens]